MFLGLFSQFSVKEGIMKPFTIQEFNTPGFFEKITKKEPEINLVVEINNYLSHSELNELSENFVPNLYLKYGIKKGSHKTKAEIANLLRNFLIAHLGNPNSITNSFKDAQKMQRFLHLDDSVFNDVYFSVADARTKNLALNMLSDNRIDKIEERQLNEWKTLLNLSDHQIEEIFQPIGQNIVNNYVKQITEDNRISPEEEHNLYQLISDLKSELKLNPESQSNLQFMKQMWNIENEPLTPITIDILLPKNEMCYFRTSSDLYENRKVTTRLSYGGPTARVKIMKGVYYRVGSVSVRSESKDVLTKIDTGSLYITNKRVLFVGSKQNKPIKLSQIIDFEVYSDGIEIVKDSGKNLVFMINQNVKIAATYLARSIKDAHEM
jgi:hypothetical protein